MTFLSLRLNPAIVRNADRPSMSTNRIFAVKLAGAQDRRRLGARQSTSTANWTPLVALTRGVVENLTAPQAVSQAKPRRSMKIICHEIDKQSLLQTCEDTAPTGAWLQDERTRWLDIEAPTDSALRELLTPLNLDEAVFQFLAVEESSQIAQFEDGGDTHYFRAPLPIADDRETRYATFLCLPHLLITVHAEDIPVLTQVQMTSSRQTALLAATVHGLAYQILRRFADADVVSYFELRRTVDRVVNSINESPGKEEVETILATQRPVSYLLNNCEDHMHIQSKLWELERSVGGQLQDILRMEAYEGMEVFRSVLTRLERRLQDLHQRYQLTLQDVTNNRLRFLTILSSVFLPMTFIAGVYGMNFQQMPELDEPYAYYIALLSMAVIGAGMLAFFHIKGWFK